MGLTESEVEWERMLQANMDALDDPNKLPEVAWPKELLYRFYCVSIIVILLEIVCRITYVSIYLFNFYVLLSKCTKRKS